MSAALWEMARTPPPEEVRRALGYRSFGVDAAARGGFGSDDDAGGGRGGRRGGGEGEKDVEAWTREYDENDDVARRATTTATDAWAHSMDARRRLARIAAATKDAAMYGMHRLDLEKNPTGTTPPRLSLATGGNGRRGGGPAARGVPGPRSRRSSRRCSTRSRRDPRRRPGGDARSPERAVAAAATLGARGRSANARRRPTAGGGGGAYGEGDGDSDRWSPEDAANVRARARGGVARGDRGAGRSWEEERRVRESVGVSVGELLDARVELAAATARAVSEEAAMSVVAVAAEAASLRMTVNERARGGDPDEPTAAKLAEYLAAAAAGRGEDRSELAAEGGGHPRLDAHSCA